MICQIIKVRIALGAGALRQSRVLLSAFNVTGSFTSSRRVRRSGLTAGWFFSCLRTVPNKDDMVDNPVAGGVLFAEDLAKMRASAEDRLRFFFPLQARTYTERYTTSSAVSQSHNATTTAVHICTLLDSIPRVRWQLLKKKKKLTWIFLELSSNMFFSPIYLVTIKKRNKGISLLCAHILWLKPAV